MQRDSILRLTLANKLGAEKTEIKIPCVLLKYSPIISKVVENA